MEPLTEKKDGGSPCLTQNNGMRSFEHYQQFGYRLTRF